MKSTLQRLPAFLDNLSSTGKTRLKRGIILAFYALLLAVAAWVGWKYREVLIAYLAQADYSRLWGVLLGYIASLFATLVGWFGVVRSLDSTLGWWQNTIIYLTTFAYRRLPGTLWYVGGRMVLYEQQGVPKSTILVASSIELVAEMMTGFLVGLTYILSGVWSSSRNFIFILPVVLLGFALLHPSVINWILKRIRKITFQKVDPKYWLLWLPGYIFMWIFSGWMICQIILAFQPLDLRQQMLVIGAWGLSGFAGLATVFLPSSFGVAEISLAFLLSQVIPLPLAGMVAIIVRIVTTLFEILMSVLFMLYSRLLK